jgi:hypothetical protein
MSLVRGLTGDPEGLGDVLPRPTLSHRTLHGITFHSIGEPAEGDDRSELAGGILR